MIHFLNLKFSINLRRLFSLPLIYDLLKNSGANFSIYFSISYSIYILVVILCPKKGNQQNPHIAVIILPLIRNYNDPT